MRNIPTTQLVGPGGLIRCNTSDVKTWLAKGYKYPKPVAQPVTPVTPVPAPASTDGDGE